MTNGGTDEASSNTSLTTSPRNSVSVASSQRTLNSMLQAGSRMTNGGTAPAISHSQMSIADMIKYFHDRDKFRLATSKAAMKDWNFDINMFPSQSAYSKVRARYQRGY